MNSFFRFIALSLSALRSFLAHDGLTLAAALAFYTALSVAPIIVLSVWIAASIGEGNQANLLEQIGLLAGPDTQRLANIVILNAETQPSLGSLAGIISLGLLLLSATAIFAQLQSSLNLIWGIPNKPTNAIWSWLRRRALCLGMLGIGACILIGSLVISTVLGTLLTPNGALWDGINQLTALSMFTIIFVSLFKFLPDVELSLRDTIKAGTVTAILFTFGKYAIGIYLAHIDAGGPYGPAGSLIVFLIWIYYSSAIFLYGAELAKAEFERPEKLLKDS